MEKNCPFMSSTEKTVRCSKQCQLFRPGKTGFECSFNEIAAISWQMRKGVGFNNNNAPIY